MYRYLVIPLIALVIFASQAEASKALFGTRSGAKPKAAPANGYSEEARFDEYNNALQAATRGPVGLGTPVGGGRASAGGGTAAAGSAQEVSLFEAADSVTEPEPQQAAGVAAESDEADEDFALGGPEIPYDPKKLPALIKEMEALYAKLLAAEARVKKVEAEMAEQPDWMRSTYEHIDEGKNDLAEIIKIAKSLPTDKPTKRLGNEVEDWEDRMTAVRDDIAYAEESEAEWREKLKAASSNAKGGSDDGS